MMAELRGGSILMNNVFNTTFEASLRVLLMLHISKEKYLTGDMIAAADFITVYGKDFGIADVNLHGNNVYKFSEFAFRRELIKKAIKQLVLNNLIQFNSTNNGFSYYINQNGLHYCQHLTSEYANSYRQIAMQTHYFINNKTECEVLKIINQRSLSSLREGYINE